MSCQALCEDYKSGVSGMYRDFARSANRRIVGSSSSSTASAGLGAFGSQNAFLRGARGTGLSAFDEKSKPQKKTQSYLLCFFSVSPVARLG